VSAEGLAVAAVALSIERIAYAAIWWRPERFRALYQRRAPGRTPVSALRQLFYAFKLIQGLVFLAWIAGHGAWLRAEGPEVWSSDPRALALGAAMIAAGQVLNFGVFYRLGSVGVFYGNRFGYDVPWVRGFPFSVLAHPQYVGAVVSIWGLFLATRFPHGDWFSLPLLETLYYAVSARLESTAIPRADHCSRGDPVVECPPGGSDVACTLSGRVRLGHGHRVLPD